MQRTEYTTNRLAIVLLMAAFSLSNTAPSVAQGSPQAAPGPELRAFWVDGFNDGYKTAAQCDSLLEQLRADHCNAVFVQMRKRGDAYYASHYEPWAADDTDHFDALAYLCAAAHAPGKPYIQVHAWVNACAVGGSHNPNSIVSLHPEWLSISDTGADFDGESTKIDPGNPGAADWTWRVYMDIVRNYPVDGIHMDFIRYGGDGPTVGHWGYNPVSVARFGKLHPAAASPPLWNDPTWTQWRRDQVTALVRRIYLSATALRPNIIVSAATICWGDGPLDDADYEAKSAAYTSVLADWRDWMKEGILDINCPMTYVTQDTVPLHWKHWSDFVKGHQYGRLSAMGIGAWKQSIAGSMAQIVDTRTVGPNGQPAAGAVIFSYAGTDTVAGKELTYDPAFHAALTANDVWTQDVATPDIPWKTRPMLGSIDGVVLSDSLDPVDGAAVDIEWDLTGAKWTTTTDGNGFWGLVGLPAGHYTLFINGQLQRVLITRGKVTEIDPHLGHRRVAGTGTLAEGATVNYVGAIVTVGTDKLGTFFYVADGFGKPVVMVVAPSMPMPTVAGDRIALTGTVHHADGSTIIEASAVRMLGAVLGR